MAAQGRIRLNPEARRMALSMVNLINHITRRDLKLVASGKHGIVIFPTDNAALTAAVALIRTRLLTITPRLGIPFTEA